MDEKAERNTMFKQNPPLLSLSFWDKIMTLYNSIKALRLGKRRAQPAGAVVGSSPYKLSPLP